MVGGVFGAGDVLAPFGVAFADGEVGHEMVGGGAVPVPFAAGGVDGVASSDGGDGFSPGLDAAFAFGDVHGLGDGVAVPGGPGAGREMYEADAGRGVSMALGDAVDPDVTGEPVGRSFLLSVVSSPVSFACLLVDA